MSKSVRAKAPNAKLKRAAIVKGLPKDKSAELKLSSWYGKAAQSIRISNNPRAESRDEAPQ
jgi:hypothetical protein